MSGIERVPFYEDQIDAYQDADGKVWVSVKRVCDTLWIDDKSQQEKLKSKPWATGGLRPLVADDGKIREQFCIDIDSLPMWLATIDTRNVKPAARPKLIRYQRECARVLRDHFFGRPGSGSVQPDLVAAISGLATALARQAELQERLAIAVEDLAVRVTAIENAKSGTVTSADASWLRRELTSIAHYEAAAGARPSFRSALRRLQNELGAAVQWFGAGRSWATLPAERFPIARAWVLERRKALDAAMAARQLPLPIIRH